MKDNRHDDDRSASRVIADLERRPCVGCGQPSEVILAYGLDEEQCAAVTVPNGAIVAAPFCRSCLADNDD